MCTRGPLALRFLSVHISVLVQIHLLLILVLQLQPLLDAVAGLQKDFPLCALGENPHKHPRQVDADEQHRVGHQLHTDKNRHARPNRRHLHTACEPEGTLMCGSPYNHTPWLV